VPAAPTPAGEEKPQTGVLGDLLARLPLPR
jgi:hypothetical protein